MKGLNTQLLLKELLCYEFFDWDNESDSNQPTIFLGMPEEICNSLEIKDFYSSWGFESVENKYSDVSIDTKKWIELENAYFNWLKKTEPILFPAGKVIVTPDLNREWQIDQYVQSEILNQFLDDVRKYEDLLVNSRVIVFPPDLRENYRGALIENYEELQTLGKLSVKGVPLLFFSDRKWVIRLTEYLTIKIIAKDKELLDQTKEELMKVLNPTILE